MTHRWGHNAVTLNSSLNVIGGRFAGGKQFERIVPYAHLRERSQHGPILLQVRFQRNKVLNLITPRPIGIHVLAKLALTQW